MSAGLIFNALTAPNHAIDDVKKLLFDAIVDPEKLGTIAKVMPNVMNGDKLGFVGEFGLVGSAAQGCSPTYGQDGLPVRELEWDMKEWGIYEELCYKDVEGTLAEVLLNKKTNIGDLSDGDIYREYVAGVLLPRLESAIEKMLVRFAWFGDKNAETNSNGGNLVNTVDKKYFNLIDGFWKLIFTLATSKPNARVTVAANSEATIEAQKAAILASGVATGIFDKLIMSAAPVLRAASNKVIYTTLALKDALDYDIRNSNKGSDLQWKSIFGGIQETTYNGITLRAVPVFDEIIQSYYSASGAWYLPFRAVLTTEDNLLVGIGAANEIADVQTYFDWKDEKNYIKAKDKVGALVRQDELITVAY